MRFSSSASRLVRASIGAPSTASSVSPTRTPARAAGPSETTSVTLSRPLRRYSSGSKRSPSRPVVGRESPRGPETPECEAFSSPTMSWRMRRISSGVREPATWRAYARRTASQSTPFICGSEKLSRR